MSFEWPLALWFLLLVPLLVGLYVLILKRRKKASVQFASLGLVKAALGRSPQWRRHVPPVLLLLALTVLIVSTARPVATVLLPTQQETVILAMDVSGSMRATDVEPNRIQASQAAAKAFLEQLPARTKVGIVSFAATASVVQAPTLSREELVSAIDRFQLQRGTAIGSGLIVSLATLFPEAGIDVSSLIYGNRPSDVNEERSANANGGNAGNAPIGSTGREPAKAEPVEPGSNGSAVIILLTDGQRTTGPDPIEAAKMVADRGVRVYTVGIGTKDGSTIGFEGWSMRVRLDEESLKRIADMTRAEYFYAGTAVDLKKIYESLNSRIAFEKRRTEITALFAAIAALLVTLATALSLWWHNRVL